jgi:PST family polysaccharide transporter
MAKASFAGALRWALVMNWGRHGVQSTITLVLAGVLGPEAFGLVAMALVYLAFFQVFVGQGLTGALIQRPDLEPHDLDTAFWLVLVSTLALFGASVAAAEAWAAFNRTPDLARVVHFLAPTLLFQGLAVVHQATLQKQMDFKSLAIRSNVSVLVGGAAGLGLALSGFGLWALVAQQLLTSSMEMVLLWKLSRWRPRARFSWEVARELYSFSSRVLLNKLGVFAHRRSDALILGYFFGPVALALYRMAERLMQLVIEFSTRSVAQVALPNFARLQRDPGALRAGVITTLKTSSIIGIPALAGLAVVGGTLVELIGDHWLPSAPVLQVLCLLGAARTLTLFTGSLLQAIGRPGLMATMTWSLALLNIASFTAAGFWLRDLEVPAQILGIGAVRTGIFALLYVPTNLALLISFSGNTLRRLLRAVLPALVGAGSTVVAALAVRSAFADAGLPAVVGLIAQVAGGAVAGIATLHLIDAEFRGQVAALIGRKALAEPVHPRQSGD